MTPAPTVAILHPGEMGAGLSALLIGRGIRVVTTIADRSAKTIGRCRAAGITVLPSLEAVVREAGAVISLVTPSAAADVAQAYCRLAELAPKNAIYIDANSIGPESIEKIAGQFDELGLDFVDGAINGLAKNLASTATLFLSGPRAAEVAGLFGDAMQISLLGSRIGQASAMKMLLSGIAKGACALFVETALTAERHGMLPEAIATFARIYPGVMSIVDRMLPTYAQHAGRRAEEMREAEQTVAAAGVEADVMQAVRRIHERIAEVNFDGPGDREWTVESIVVRLSETMACPSGTK